MSTPFRARPHWPLRNPHHPLCPAFVATIAIACTGNQVPDDTSSTRPPSVELEYRERYFAEPIDLTGTVLDLAQHPIRDAKVSLAEASTTTDAEGRFALEGLDRRASLLTIAAGGYQAERIPVSLQVPLETGSVSLPPVLLARRVANEARFLFAGDTSLGRGFISPGGENSLTSVPDPSPDVLIPSDDAGQAARAVVSRVAPLFELADYASLNLESVVTDSPDTPIGEKNYVYFSLPDSLTALEEIGVDFVSLGNNHVYDYQEQGLMDTVRHVAGRAIGLAGAGINPSHAFSPFRSVVDGVKYSMVSASSIEVDASGARLVAGDEQGGAANARDTEQLTDVILAEAAAGRFPITHLHLGVEYAQDPLENSRELTHLAIDQGASLVVTHHPHVTQGFEWYQDHLIAHSLGNFVFDQERVETMLSHLLRVDLSGAELQNARSVPIYIEDYQPRPITGAAADVQIRRTASHSSSYGALVFPYLSQGWVVRPGEAEITTETLDVPVAIDASGVAIVDMRLLADSTSSVAKVEVSAEGVSARIGQDILMFGDMEDADVDEDDLENSLWWYSNAASFPCMHQAHRGAVALCAQRSWDDKIAAILSFRNRLRVLGDAEEAPQKDLSLIAYTQAENAGPVTIDVRYYASAGDAEFGEERVWEGGSGSWDWEPAIADLHVPSTGEDARTDARALRISIEQSPPKRGQALFRIDDVAVVSWQESIELDGSEELSVPHGRDFLRFEGPPGEFVAKITVKWLSPMAEPAASAEP